MQLNQLLKVPSGSLLSAKDCLNRFNIKRKNRLIYEMRTVYAGVVSAHNVYISHAFDK